MLFRSNYEARRSINLYCYFLKNTILTASKFIEKKSSEKEIKDKIDLKKTDNKEVKVPVEKKVSN